MTHNDGTVPTAVVATISKESWLRSFMEKCSLKNYGSNFSDWEANLRNAATAYGKLNYLTYLIPIAPTARSTGGQRTSYDEFVKEACAIKNLLIYAMQPNLQRRFITQNANRIFTTLTNEFSQAPRILKYEVTTRFFDVKLLKGQPVSPHILNMIENTKKLELLGCKLTDEIVIDKILHSLQDGFNHFRLNFNMNDMKKSLHELHALLKQAEKDMRASVSIKKDVLIIKNKGKAKAKPNLNIKKKSFNKSVQWKGKGNREDGQTSNPKVKKGASVDQQCFNCQQSGHWKQNCPKFLEDIAAGRVTPSGPKASKTTG